MHCTDFNFNFAMQPIDINGTDADDEPLLTDVNDVDSGQIEVEMPPIVVGETLEVTCVTRDILFQHHKIMFNSGNNAQRCRFDTADISTCGSYTSRSNSNIINLNLLS